MKLPSYRGAAGVESEPRMCDDGSLMIT